MGDPARFRIFADAIGAQFPDRSLRIADVASGGGGLQAALYRLGYRDVTSWDVRPRNAGPRRRYRYGRFEHATADRRYDLAIGMHPDRATDHIVLYAIGRRVPFAVVPCCVMPDAAPYGGARASYTDWMRHLIGLARSAGMRVADVPLAMRGRNRMLIGWPKGGG